MMQKATRSGTENFETVCNVNALTLTAANPLPGVSHTLPGDICVPEKCHSTTVWHTRCLVAPVYGVEQLTVFT